VWRPQNHGTHNFNTEEYLDNVGTIPDVSYYGAYKISESERIDFLAWYEIQKNKGAVFDTWRVFEP